MNQREAGVFQGKPQLLFMKALDSKLALLSLLQ